jgi:hypothetical protein
LGIGPNPQSPIPNPQNPIPIIYINSDKIVLNIINKDFYLNQIIIN